MTEIRIPYQPKIVTPPGETLADLLDERCMTQTELAQRMGRPINKINEIIRGKRSITPDTALQLERVLGTPSSYWLNHEAHYQAYQKRVEEEETLHQWHDWLAKMPLNVLKEQGFLPKVQNRGKNKNVLVRSLLNFFSVSSPTEWEAIYGNMQITYRQSMPEQSDPYATGTWLRLGELQAIDTDCNRYDRQRFLSALQTIRALTVEPPSEFEPRLRELCAEAGVVLALVPAIPRARVSGAARWFNGRPLIQLSLYGKSNDRFWFTFFHEAGHILKHSHQLVYLDDRTHGQLNEVEQEANEFAADLLIPSCFVAELTTLKSKVAVKEFAARVGVHPGIVVGRLQHEGIVPQKDMNGLKAKFVWKVAEKG